MSLAAEKANSSPRSTSAVTLVAQRGGKKLYRVDGNTSMDVDERYDILSVVGRGSYGIVCSARDTLAEGDAMRAIKKIDHIFADLIDGRRIYREICILRILTTAKARNVVPLRGLLRPTEGITQYNDLYIVTDLCSGDLGSLNSSAFVTLGEARVRHRQATFFDGVRCVAVDLLSAIADMHALRLIHRDVKPQNVLFCGSSGSQKPSFLLCDFGLARGLGKQQAARPTNLTDHVVTRWYRAPELLLMSPYHFPVDIFSAGCVIAEAILRKALFQGRDYLDQVRLIVTGLFPHGIGRGGSCDWITQDVAKRFVAECPKLRPVIEPGREGHPNQALSLSVEERLALAGTPQLLIGLVLRLLAFDPSKRLTAAEALSHPAISELVVPHADPALLRSNNAHVWSIDAPVAVSEAHLRRLVWDEVHAQCSG